MNAVKVSHISETTDVEDHALCQVIENTDQDVQIMVVFSEKWQDDFTTINYDSRISERLNTQHGLVAASNLVINEIKPFPSNEMSNAIKEIMGKYDSCSDQRKCALSSVFFSLKDIIMSNGKSSVVFSDN